MRPLDTDEPTVVGPYRLLGRLGSGGMGRVYLGRSAGGRTVAVKIVHPHFALDEEFRARFRREIDAARRVGGAWTASVLDADPEARVPWVATAYAAGPSLAAAVTDAGPLPAHTVRTLGAGLAEALTAVHELGLVHRDVKPSNVLLTLDGPLLIDFGIARAMDGTASLTSTGVSIGSPGYMSPEQILGKGVTGAADVFSLGAVLAYAATGRPPFPGDSSAALLYKVVHEPPELGEWDGDVRELTLACLAKDPAARPAPAEVARRLAPEGGAARLVAGGWLPGPLVEQVSRSAVQLLNLDAAGDAPSGPVDFSRRSVNDPVPGGTFGPPPVMPDPRTPAPGPYAAGGPHAGPSGATDAGPHAAAWGAGPGASVAPGAGPSGATDAGPHAAASAESPAAPGVDPPTAAGSDPHTPGTAGPHAAREAGPYTSPGAGADAGRGPHAVREVGSFPSPGAGADVGRAADSPAAAGAGRPAVAGAGPHAVRDVGPYTSPGAGADAAREAGPYTAPGAAADAGRAVGPPAAPGAGGGAGSSVAGAHGVPGAPDSGAGGGAVADAGAGFHMPTQTSARRSPAGGPGKLSVSVAATAAPGAGGKGRRVSCTVALAVAGALAAVTVGSVFVLELLPGTGKSSGDHAGDGSAGSKPPAAVLDGYLGTWEGQASARDSLSIPLGTFRVTVEDAEVGERVGTVRHTDILGGVCDDVLTLKRVTDKQLVASSAGVESNRDVCDQTPHTVRLTPVGDDLVYESDSKPSGRPKARLSKLG